MADLRKMCIIKRDFGIRSGAVVYWYETEEVGDMIMATLYHSPSCPSSYRAVPIDRIERVTPEMVTVVNSQAIFSPDLVTVNQSLPYDSELDATAP